MSTATLSHDERLMALVEIRDVHKVFQRDAERIEIFTGLTLESPRAPSPR